MLVIEKNNYRYERPRFCECKRKLVSPRASGTHKFGENLILTETVPLTHIQRRRHLSTVKSIFTNDQGDEEK